jgi:hypothetical protein
MLMAGTKDTVTVGCKLPNGIVLDLYGPRTPDRAQVAPQLLKSFTLKGSRFPTDDNGVARATWDVVGGSTGFGLTENVPADFWNAWLEAHKESELVTNGIVFAVPTLDDAKSEGAKRADTKSGFEPLDPEKPAPGIEKSDDVK